MPAVLAVQVSDDLLAALRDRAVAEGSTPEAVAAEQLGRALVPPKPGDLLRKWVGAFESGVPDAGVNHDRYIGDALADELRGRPGE